MKRKNRTYPFILVSMLFLISMSCKKDNNNNSGNGIIFNPNLTYNSISDIDGNTYKTITIGTQTWMAENLKTTKYRDGSAIPNITDNTEWGNSETDMYCNYNNKPSNNTTYGKLYNYYTVIDSRNLCPAGWHVPTDEEWSILNTYLEGEIVAGGELKEIGTSHWLNPNTGASNATGFTALPGGGRYADGYFGDLLYFGNWWSSSDDGFYNAWSLYMSYDDSNLSIDSRSQTSGFSVRCVKD